MGEVDDRVAGEADFLEELELLEEGGEGIEGLALHGWGVTVRLRRVKWKPE